MADEPSIKINPTKKTSLEFNVIIQGIDNFNIPTVRFVISSEAEMCDYSFKCTKVEGEQDLWLAKLPELTHLKESTHKFHLEIIVDGYYFEPAQGTLLLVTDPSVKFQPTVSKPIVKTSFTVKQDEEPKKEEKPTEVKKKEEKSAEVKKNQEGDELNEAMNGGGGGEITGQYAPTNALLKKEMAPKQSTRKTAQAEVYDQFINREELDGISSNVLPGEGTDPPPEENPKGYVQDTEDDDETSDIVDLKPFDAKSVAENIVKGTLGNLAKTAGKKGSLFKRTAGGKPIVDGLKDPTVEAEKHEKSKRVKEILNK